MATSLKDEITHILFHVDAEIADDDQSQSPGKEGRGAKLKAVLNRFAADSRVMERKQLIEFLEQETQDLELKAVFQQMDLDDDGQRIRHVLQAWVGGQRQR